MSSLPSSLLPILNVAANVHIVDDVQRDSSLFGELISPQDVIAALWDDAGTTNGNGNDIDGAIVGMPKVKTTPAATGKSFFGSQSYAQTTYVNSKNETVTPHEMPFEVHNMTKNVVLRIRWIDHNGECNSSSHQWDVAPSSTFIQYTGPGHFFVFSIIVDDDKSKKNELSPSFLGIKEEDTEYVVGAYRLKRSLPSSMPHCLSFYGSSSNGSDDDDGGNDPNILNQLFVLETIFLDETKFDLLTIVSYWFDHNYVINRGKNTCNVTSSSTSDDRRRIQLTTIQLLRTIIQNIINHPNESKYHKLRLSNKKVKKYITNSSWYVIEILYIVGFVHHRHLLQEEEEKMKKIQQQKQHNNNNDDDDDCKKMPSTNDGKEDKQQREIQEDDDEEGYLIIPTPRTETSRTIGQTAIRFLDIIESRLQPSFIIDIAPPTPWTVAVLEAVAGANRYSNGSSSGSNFNWASNPGRGFISDEERWARAERISRLRRSGAARKPAPGEAPSSRGKWGR